MKAQVIFNRQRWGDEALRLSQLRDNLINRSGGKVVLDFLPSVYSGFGDLPFGDFYNPMNPSETGRAIQHRWFVDNIYPLANKDADVVYFVSRSNEWKGLGSNGATTYGYCHHNAPPSFPVLIEMMVEENDRSWRYPNQLAFVHYGTHELAHGLEELGHASAQDRTHELDYRDENGINELFAAIDYQRIFNAIKNKRDLSNPMIVYQRQGDATLYFHVGGDSLVPISASWENVKQDCPSLKPVIISQDEFLKYRIANKILVSDRK